MTYENAMNTKNLEIRICEHCHQNFEISNEELVLYKKIGIELPVICFFCRIKNHLSFWMFGKFRKGKSDLSGENLITILPENNRYPIYTFSEWNSDKWEALDYGMDYDPTRSFFAQLEELQEKIPHPHQDGSNNIGCDYCDDVWSSKNCYLSRSMKNCKDLYYSYRNLDVKNSIDMAICFFCEKSFDCSDCHNSYKLFYSKHSRDCIESSFLYDCRNCQNCFMSWNLRNKSYCIENVQYTKEEYEEKIKSFNLGSYESILKHKKRFEEVMQTKVVHRNNFNLKAYDSDGDTLLNVKNCHECFTVSDSEDCSNCLRCVGLKSCIDICGGLYMELSGNCNACVGGSYCLKYSNKSSSRYSEYLDLCIECEYCFGCIGLKKKNIAF